MNTSYSDEAPERVDVDRLAGPTLIEFGSRTCGWCRRAQPLIAQAMQPHEAIRHLKIEDGPGRPLGRSYKVKLWPTLIFLRDGAEVSRLVRPDDARAIAQALASINPSGA